MPTPVRLLHIVGSRPQFAKVAAVSRGLAAAAQELGTAYEERLVHTGQHYDHGLSQVFFDEFQLRAPDFYLGVGSGNHAHQTALTLTGVADVIGEWPPDRVVVYGDTNATLGAALAGAQAKLPVAHVEAGVRTWELAQAEELNRAVADRISTQRFCCTQHNLRNLTREGLGAGSHFTGDTMLDNYRFNLPRMDKTVVRDHRLAPGAYILATVHRAENTDDAERLNALLDGLLLAQREVSPVVLPIHPRTAQAIARLGRAGELEAAGVMLLPPQGFAVTQALLEQSRVVLSDSGGLLRESYFAGRYCVIPWEFAAWPELVEAGWADCGPLEAQSLVNRLAAAPGPRAPEADGLFGAGDAGVRIARLLLGAG